MLLRDATRCGMSVLLVLVLAGGCSDDDGSRDRSAENETSATSVAETSSTPSDRPSGSSGTAPDAADAAGAVVAEDDPAAPPGTVRNDRAARGVVGEELPGTLGESVRVHAVRRDVTDEDGAYDVVVDAEVCAGPDAALPLNVAGGRFELETSAGQVAQSVNSPAPAFGAADLSEPGVCHRGNVAFDLPDEATVQAVLDLVAGVQWAVPQ